MGQNPEFGPVLASLVPDSLGVYHSSFSNDSRWIDQLPGDTSSDHTVTATHRRIRDRDSRSGRFAPSLRFHGVPLSAAVLTDHDPGTKVYRSFRQLRTVLLFVGALRHVLDPILATYPLMQ